MLTLQFVPYTDISKLPSEERIKKLLSLAKEEKIVLLEGRLTEREQADLIKKTMEEVDGKFTGIEPCVIEPKSASKGFLETVHKFFIKILLGNRDGFTIIGPANVVKEIKKDPDKIQLYTKEKK